MIDRRYSDYVASKYSDEELIDMRAEYLEELEEERKLLNKMSENKNELEVKYEIDGNPIRLTFDIVQKFIVGNQANISLPEYKFFTELCKVRKLNPFMKEAYLIRYV